MILSESLKEEEKKKMEEGGVKVDWNRDGIV